jgi:predicted permease
MTHDLRFALRMIVAHRWFSAAVVATLALGIGLNTMVFTLVNAALFKPVPVPRGERLVAIVSQDLNRRGENGRMGVSFPDFRDYRVQQSTLESLEAAANEPAVLSERGNPPQPYGMARVSTGLFTTLHIQPVLGRAFLPTDDRAGAEPVVLLGYSVWKDRYASSPTILGRSIRVNEKPATIIGVMPERFQFPSNEDLWMPLSPTPEMENRQRRNLQVFGILKSGTPIAKATADLDAIAHRLSADHPETNKDMGALVQTFQERYNGGNIRMVFLLMLAAVGFVLMIACANVANMMISRTLGRQREMSIRAAMGASRWQVIRQLLIESLLLSALGGVLGLAISWLGVYQFDLASSDVGRPYWVQFTMDYRVFGYFAAMCLLSALLFGLAPALRSSRVDLNNALRDSMRTAGTQHGGKMASVLVVLQFALTLVLLTGAGMFARSFISNQSLNPFVPADRILTARIRLPKDRYTTPESRQRFYDQLLPQIGALPGVTNTSIASDLPGVWAFSRHIEIEGVALPDPSHKDPSHKPSASVVVQSPGHFATVNLRVIQGRDFNSTDTQSAIVSKQFAERYWPNQEALARRFRFFDNDKPGNWLSVVGVSANIVQEPNEASPNPLLFLPYRQESFESIFLVVRTTGNPSSFVSAVRATVQNMDQDLPLFEVRTLAGAIAHNRWFLAVFGTVFLVFAMIALVIASVGIYAVIAQATARRTQEIGVRMALGATSRNILALVISRGMKQLAVGLALGLAAAIPAARLINTLPFGVSKSDPLVLTGVCLLLTSVGLFASWLPARRAAQLSPVTAIRYE